MKHHSHPRGYFADAPTLAAPENLGQLRQPTRSGVAERRETSGGSCAATLSPAGQPTAAGQDSPHCITGASPELETAPADDAATGRQGRLSPARAQQLRAARIISGRS